MADVTDSRHDDLPTLVDEYLEYGRSFRGLADQTISAYRRDLRKFIDWAQAHGLPDDPADFERQHIQRFVDSLAGLSPATIRRAAYCISGFLSHLQRQGLITTNSAAALVLPKRRRRLPKVPTLEQAQRLLAAACDERERAILACLLQGGLRRAEVTGLDCEAVSNDCSELMINGKGDVQRLIPLPPSAQVALLRHIEKEGIEAGPVFRGRTGRRLQQTSFQRLWRRVLERAGLVEEGFTLHGCRHSYVTMLVRAGTDLKTVQELCGHRDLSTTAQYAHSDLRTKRAAVAHVDFDEVTAGGGVA